RHARRPAPGPRSVAPAADDHRVGRPDDGNPSTKMKKKPSKSFLSAAQKKILREQRGRVPAELQAAFDAAVTAWKETWFSGGLAVSSNPHTRTVGEELGALIALGPGILPLVVDALADPDNCLALQLYD